MTRERLQKPAVTPHLQPETTLKARGSSGRGSRSVVLSKLELHAPTPLQLEAQQQHTLELQSQHDLKIGQLEVQRSHDARLSQARVAQKVWRTSSLKTPAVQRALSDHTRTARVAADTRAAFVAQRSQQHLERLVTQRLQTAVLPEVTAPPRGQTPSLGYVAEIQRSRAEEQVNGDPTLIRNYQGFKNTGATLVKHFRSPGSSHTMGDLAGAIQRFTDPGQRGAVESAAFAALGHHPSFPGQLQRALDARAERLEGQREIWQRELEPIAQRQALEEASGNDAAEQIAVARGSGQPLPENVRAMLEVKWNVDLSKVRVHLDSSADGISRKLNAKALTAGNDIFFRAGTWNPTSLEGLQLIAHETWHTVQQGNGLVQAGVDRDHGLEVEAQRKGNQLSHQDLQTTSSGKVDFKPAHVAGVPQTLRTAAISNSNALQRQAAATRLPVAPTTGQEVAYDTLVARLVALVPEDMRPFAAANLPLLLQQCRQSDMRNPDQVAYVLATARHEARFGQPRYSRSEPLVEDHNPVRTRSIPETRVVDGHRVRTTREESYRVSHVTGRTIPGDDLNTYYDDAYGGRLGNVRGTSDAADFRGRGLVQLTGRNNYATMSRQLGEEGFQYTVDGVTYGTAEHPIDLTANPTHVNRVPELAARITVSGMRQGTFTGRGLSADITDTNTDFVNARRVVNGDKDKIEPNRTESNGEIVAGYARSFAAELREGDAWKNLFPSGSAAPAVQRAPDGL